MPPRRQSGVIVLSVCQSVCLFVCRQNSSEPTNIGTLKILPADVKSYIGNNMLLLKPSCFKVMTIFVTHSCLLTNFRWGLVAKDSLKHSSSCLKPIAIDSQLEMKYNWSSGCYNLELALSFLPWLAISSSTYLFHPHDWSCFQVWLCL